VARQCQGHLFVILTFACEIKALTMTKKKQVLIIEDDEMSSELYEEALTGSFIVDVASDGEEGLKMALAKSYDLILCDLKLPKISGISIIKKLEELQVPTKIAVISGFLNDEVNVELHKCQSVIQLFRKPFGQKDLLGFLRQFFSALDEEK